MSANKGGVQGRDLAEMYSEEAPPKVVPEERDQKKTVLSQLGAVSALAGLQGESGAEGTGYAIAQKIQ